MQVLVTGLMSDLKARKKKRPRGSPPTRPHNRHAERSALDRHRGGGGHKFVTENQKRYLYKSHKGSSE